MLHMLDTLLTFLFSYGLYYAIIVVGIVVPFICLYGIKEHPDLAIGMGGIIPLCSYWFSHSWVHDKTNYCSVIVGAAVFLLCAFMIPNFMKMSKVPFIITLIIYAGIAVYGF